MHPAWPRGRVRTGIPCLLQFIEHTLHFKPGLWRLVSIELGFAESVFVIEQNWRRVGNRQTNHPTFFVDHASLQINRDIGSIEWHLGISHHLIDRLELNRLTQQLAHIVTADKIQSGRLGTLGKGHQHNRAVLAFGIKAINDHLQTLGTTSTEIMRQLKICFRRGCSRCLLLGRRFRSWLGGKGRKSEGQTDRSKQRTKTIGHKYSRKSQKSDYTARKTATHSPYSMTFVRKFPPCTHGFLSP